MEAGVCRYLRVYDSIGLSVQDVGLVRTLQKPFNRVCERAIYVYVALYRGAQPHPHPLHCPLRFPLDHLELYLTLDIALSPKQDRSNLGYPRESRQENQELGFRV